MTSDELNLLTITEMWLHNSTDKQIINEVVPVGFEIKYTPRSKIRGGGDVAILFQSAISI